MYVANIYNVMIASPGDVEEERKAARQIILDWNNNHSFHRRIVLQPLTWENNTIPDSGDRPQEIVNEQILKHADLLVGIFWTRIGSPTGNAISGTVEEITKHVAAGKPAMIYFSEKSISPKELTSKNAQAQLKAVEELKKEMQNRSLYSTFKTLSDFKKQFQRHITLKINDALVGYPINKENFVNDNLTDSQLSDKAIILLLEAVKDRNGTIVNMSHKGGTTIQTNQKNFTSSANRRIQAEWEEAFLELLDNRYITNRGGSLFPITNKAYKLADQLKKDEPDPLEGIF